MKSVFHALFLLFFVILSAQSFAFYPEERIDDEVKEQRALNLFKEVKCLVCQGQSIAGSNTEFSANLRKIIRQKISAGLIDEEIKGDLQSEFGQQILFFSDSPSLNNRLLILLPITLSLIFLYLFIRRAKRK